VALAAEWDRVLSTPFGQLAEPRTLRELRAIALGAADRATRAGAAELWAREASALGRRSTRAARRRHEEEQAIEAEREGEPQASSSSNEVASGAGLALEAARQLLDETEPMALELREASWWEGLHATLGVEAAEGWPATLNARWAGEVFRGSSGRLAQGVIMGSMPRPLGALSFARVLGQYGVGLLDAARRRAPSFALHAHPRSPRRPARYALFASLLAERCFARFELGLGRSRAREHQRSVAQAMLRSVRLTAMRVLAADGLRGEPVSAIDGYVTLAQRVLGPAAPASLFGVLPELGPGDGATLLGELMATEERARLIQEHGEDWYRNPRAFEAIAAEQGTPESALPRIDRERLLRAIGELGRTFAEML